MSGNQNRYFLPSKQTWRWADKDSVILLERSMKQTICFREEVSSILEWLEPNGFPNFPTILCCFLALKDQEDFETFVENQLERTNRHERFRFRNLDQYVQDLSSEAFEKLGKNFERIINDPQLRQFWIRTVLGECRVAVPPSEARSLRNYFEKEFYACGLENQIQGIDNWNVKSLVDLLNVMNEVDYDSLEFKMKTGVSRPPKPATDQLSFDQRVVRSLENLNQTQDEAFVSNATKQLLAAAQLPRPNRKLQGTPDGGYADLSNKGTFDRLLLTELANDDDVLAVRVAMNEAMYLQRQPSAKKNHQDQYVLIHSGIRSWGVPRLLATSFALAVASTIDSKTTLQCFRSDGDRCRPVELDSLEGIQDQLSHLPISLHPGASLDHFQSQIYQPDPQSPPPLLILESSEFSDPDFQRKLSASQIDPWLIGTVDRDGELQLLKFSKSGKQTLRVVQLDVLEILNKKDVKTLTKQKTLPAICHLDRFPLRVPASINSGRFLRTKQGFLSFTNDGRLLSWNASDRGPVEVSRQIPKGNPKIAYDRGSGIVGMAFKKNDSTIVCWFHDSELIVNQITLPVIEAYQHFLIDDRWICFYNGQTTWNFELENGRQKNKNHHSAARIAGRFGYSIGKQLWMTLSSTTQGFQWEAVSPIFNSKGIRDTIKLFFHPTSADGPVAITNTGYLVWPSLKKEPLEKAQIPNFDPYSLRPSASTDMQRAVVETSKHRTEIHFYQNVPQFKDIGYRDIKLRLEQAPPVTSQFENLRKNFQSIGVLKTGYLALKTRNGAIVFLTLENDRLRLNTKKKPEDLVFSQKFMTLENSENLTLESAKWTDSNSKNQSVAVIDRRGLLHLRSANLAVPEMSIVLNEGLLSGWCSTGEVFGKEFFHHPNSAVMDDQAFYNICLQPFIQSISKELSTKVGAQT